MISQAIVDNVGNTAFRLQPPLSLVPFVKDHTLQAQSTGVHVRVRD